MKPFKTKVKKTDVYGCERCKITSETKDRMCPCPRGSCEANIIGKKIATTEVLLKPIPEKKQLIKNKKRQTLNDDDSEGVDFY